MYRVHINAFALQAAGPHAAARAVSGGPVYVSDRPGHHDFDLLKRLVLPDGGVLRCLLPGRPTSDCLYTDVSKDGKTALKIWNINPVCGVVAAFNVQGSSFCRQRRKFHSHNVAPLAVTTVVGPADVPGLESGTGVFALYSDCTGVLKLVGSSTSPSPLVPLLSVQKQEKEEAEAEGMRVELAGRGGYDVVTVAPVAAAGVVSMGPVGLVNMVNAGGAVLKFTLETDGGLYMQANIMMQ
jgi:raffinose synthase